MARGARAAPAALFEAFREVSLQGRESWREAAERSACQSKKQREGGNGCIHRDRVDARHGLRQKVQGGANRSRGKREAQQSASQAEQQALKDRFTDDQARTSAQRQSNGILMTPADGADQQQA